jgi:hypothetical protein
MKRINKVLVPSKNEVSTKNVPEGAERLKTKLKTVHALVGNKSAALLCREDQVFETCSLLSCGSSSEKKSKARKARGQSLFASAKRKLAI